MSWRWGLALLLVATTAQAQTQTRAPAPSAAELLFREGRQASDASDFERACNAFQASLELEPTRGTRLNLALCQMQLGRLLEATTNLKLVAEQLSQDDERSAMVAAHLATIAKRLSRIRLRLDAELPNEAELRIDGRRFPVRDLPDPLVMNPGEHLFELSAPGYVAERRQLQLGEGESREVALGLVHSAPEPAPSSLAPVAQPRPVARAHVEAKQERETSDPDGSRRTSGYVLLGVAGAGLLSAGISGALILREQDIVSTECPNRECSDTGLAAASRGRTLVAVAAGSLGLGLLSGAVGFYLLGTSQSRRAVAASFDVGAGQLSLQLSGRL